MKSSGTVMGAAAGFEGSEVRRPAGKFIGDLRQHYASITAR
jgi:hypothetical protein